MMAKTCTQTPCCLFLLLTLCTGYLTTACEINGVPCGDLLPTDPNATIGQPIELQCILTEEFMNTKKYNSSHISFEIRGFSGQPPIPMQGTVINESTARLYIAEVNLKHGMWDVHCLVKKPNERKTKEVEYEIMYVGYVPYKPTITDVYIFNWEDLVLKWSVPKVNPHYTAFHNGWYQLRMGSDWGSWKKCGEKKAIRKLNHLKQTCRVEGLGMNADAIRVAINASNVVATVTSDMVNSSLPALVLTAPVRNLLNYSTDKRVATLQWDSPKPPGMSTKPVEYQLIYHSPRNGFTKTVTLQSAEMYGLQTELTSLLPYTEYLVTVRCKDRASERWSENVTTSFYTQEDLPLQPPLVLEGNFEVIIKHEGMTRDAVLYWQNVPLEERNGKILVFKIRTITMLSTSHIEILDADKLKGDLSTTMKDLALNERYNFLINAGNSVGFSQTDSQKTIVIPPQDQIPPGLDASFLKLNNSSVRVMWPERQQASSVTFYWCLGNVQQQDCTGQIKWKRVSSVNSTHMEFLTDQQFGLKHLFGTSVEVDGRHSGIKWTSCVYDVKAVPRPPQFEVMHISVDRVEFRLKKPDCASSVAFIDGFVVHYCTVGPLQDQTCSGKSVERAFSVSSTGEYRIQNLDPGTKYLFHIQSSSLGALSYNATEHLRTEDEALTYLHKIILAVSLVFAFCVACVGIYTLIKFQHKLCKKWRAPIPIEVPSEQGTIRSTEPQIDIVKEIEIKTPKTEIDTSAEAMLSAPVQSSDWFGESVDLHQETTTFPQIDLEDEAGQPLIINPETFSRLEQNATTPLSSGGSDYVETGAPVTFFGSLDTQPHEDIPVMTSEDMTNLGWRPTDEMEQEDDHCRIQMRTPPFRAGEAQTHKPELSSPFRTQQQQPQCKYDESIGSIDQQQTSFMTIPPPKRTHHIPKTSESGDGINSYTCAGMLTPPGTDPMDEDTSDKGKLLSEAGDSGAKDHYVRTKKQGDMSDTPISTVEDDWDMNDETSFTYVGT